MIWNASQMQQEILMTLHLVLTGPARSMMTVQLNIQQSLLQKVQNFDYSAYEAANK